MTYKKKSELEQKELDILHSLNARDLGLAYKKFASFLAKDSEARESLSPASLVSLTLKGYEIPDAETRLESNQIIGKIDNLIDGSQREQYWLMIAQQREVILSKVEDDIEALAESRMAKSKTERAKTVLADIHKIIRKRTDEVVDGLFNNADVSQPELPLEA